MALSPSPVVRTAAALSDRLIPIALMSGGLCIGAVFVPYPAIGLLMFAVGGTLAALALFIRVLSGQRDLRHTGLLDTVSTLIRHDASPSFVTDGQAMIIRQNPVADERFDTRAGQGLSRPMREYFANPGAVLKRLSEKAMQDGGGREDVVTRRGHVRLSVRRVDDGVLLWRLDDMAESVVGSIRRGAEGLNLPMLTANATGDILFMNEATRRLLGGRRKTLDAVFKQLPLQSDQDNMLLSTEAPVRVRVFCSPRQNEQMEVFLFPVSEAAARSELPIDSEMLDDLPVAVIKMTDAGELLIANRMARDLLGKGAQPEVNLAHLVEGLGRSVRDWLLEAAEGRNLNKPEVVRARRAETEVFLQITLSRVVGEDQTTLIAVLSDATELKTLEAQFVQSQKMQAIGQLAGGVAHDFNNLLTAISGHCDLLLLRHDHGDQDYGDLVQINQNANRAASLVGQLLAFSRKQNLQPEVLDLRDTLGDLTHLLNRLVGEKIMLSLAHDSALKPMRADKRQLEQVIMNLVVNARDAMQDGGEIRVETEMRQFAEEYRRDRAVIPKGDYVIVKVSDEGVGIAPDKLNKIFEPFFTTKRTGEGTGLGLSTAYGIVKQTGGYIFVDSEVDKGTTFSLVFPAYSQSIPAPVDPPSAEAERRMNKGDGVILLVEDEAPVRAFASRALRMRGYTVLEAENAEDALSLLEDISLKIDVFVTDVIMPGLDGPSWVKRALKQRPDVKVVFVSGYAEDSFAEDQAGIPNSVFLPKPFSLNELTATVATVHDQIH
ncbi:ATP-binding protein [Actibacterium sp. 188UL27-1]|uniref:ATP-binding protein n=1 Tax=Actibacterium sp. 188UL27-1 TaxID=2786961 RepID=UPI00195CDF17|nr:ATP-binding protein [Actibacterium sp. 188UL27-1]MBM7067801.1 response regulator [Actibacterium sp. 188UL27-1]